MKANRRSRYAGGKKSILLWISLAAVVVVAAAVAVGVLLVPREQEKKITPVDLLTQYMNHIPKQEYEEMYAMLDTASAEKVSRDAFVERNSAIYEGIEAQNIRMDGVTYDEETMTVTYTMSMDTVAGSISFENRAQFAVKDDGYGLIWSDALIFPQLGSEDKVRVSSEEAERGNILDRKGQVLAGKGTASSVGIVPGKLENRETAVAQIAELLEMTPEEIEEELSAQWVTDDTFVPLKTLPKVEEMSALTASEEERQKEQERQDKLLQIPGILISDTEVRQYPLGEAAAHLVGYIQSVTAEDLQEHAGEGYTSNSVIGRTGMEGLFEEELRGRNGHRIYIVDAEGNEKEEIAYTSVQHGKNVQLTIDADLQKSLYEQFQEDKSCSVSMDPYTGEVLALVSTPSYDTNDFILGLSNEQWTALNEDKSQPLYNRFRQVWSPGSTFKPITAAIGLVSGAVDPEKDYGSEGLKWQKDESWGSYFVTTLKAYEPVTLENALKYSDNIYFAKAALDIGADELANGLDALGFNQELPFEIVMQQSQYSNTDTIDSEIQLADSGYGQGEILVNPLHMASIYTAFCNDGNMVKPYLVYREDAQPEYWYEGVFSSDTVNRIVKALDKVVNDTDGTGYSAHIEGVPLAGKTGTAEIKATQDDETGTELGWFAAFTTQKDMEKPIMIISMVEDVKDRGGSSYVTRRDKQVLENWFRQT